MAQIMVEQWDICERSNGRSGIMKWSIS